MAWSGLYDDVHGAAHALLGNKGALRQRLAKLTRRRGFHVQAELIGDLTGAAAGAATSTVQYRRAQAPTSDTLNSLGGVRTVETVTMINRVTAAADVTQIDGDLDTIFVPSTYPTDASGNGGGGKLGRY